jgi:hypothetical protein
MRSNRSKLYQIIKLQNKWISSNYLGYLISYVQIVDTDNKLKNSLKRSDILNNMFGPTENFRENKNNIIQHLQLYYTITKIGQRKQRMEEEE